MSTCEALIVGVEAASHHGVGVDQVWPKLQQDDSLPRRYDFCDLALMPHQDAYAINRWQGLVEQEISPEKDASLLSIELVHRLFKQAGLDPHVTPNVDIVLGSGMGNINLIERANRKGIPVDSHDQFHFDVVCDIANHFGFTGAVTNTASGCAAAAYAMSIAVDRIKSGGADLIITGGIDLGGRVVQGCFNAMKALDECCRPFSEYRKGTVFSQAAGFVLLESEKHYRQRNGKHLLGKLSGSGWSCDAHHVTAPDALGQEQSRAIHNACIDSDLSSDDISAILPHATGTVLNDGIEYTVLDRVFGARLKHIPAAAVKSQIGHSGGSSAAMSAVVAVRILEHQRLPVTANTVKVDETIALNLTNICESEIDNVLINAYGFGGNNCSLVVSKYDV